MRQYVLVNQANPGRSDGIRNYSLGVLDDLHRWGIDATFLARDEGPAGADYQAWVRETVTTRFSSAEVLVEAPEVTCPTLLLPPEYRVHVRLHCPSVFVQMHNGLPVDWQLFEDEMAIVRRAHAVSSPSHALLRELQPFLDVSRIHVYKNPPPAGLTPVEPAAKRHDVVFFAHFRRSKGIDYLNPVLSALPPSYSVVVAGRGAEAFRLAPAVRCRVEIRGEVRGPERYRLLGQARAALMPSRFENCSMVVLECLAVGTAVVGWDVGGHAEIAEPDLIRLVPFDDVGALVAALVAAVEGVAPAPDRFRAATAQVAEDFRRGWWHVWDGSARGDAVYRGLDVGGRSVGGGPETRRGLPTRL